MISLEYEESPNTGILPLLVDIHSGLHKLLHSCHTGEPLFGHLNIKLYKKQNK